LDNIKKNRNNYDDMDEKPREINWKNTEEKVNWYVESDMNTNVS
jgi:hypothetical protein